MADNDGDKTQEPTQYRRDQARERGQIARSQDLTSALLLCGTIVIMSWLGEALVRFFGEFTIEQLGDRAWTSFDEQSTRALAVRTGIGLGIAIGPILAAIFAWDVFINLLQVGLLFLPDKLMPDITRLDPLQGFGRIFSMPNVVKLGFGLIKIAIIAGVAYATVAPERDQILSLAELAVPQIAAYLLDTIYWVVLKVAVALFILAVLDYGYQWWKHEQDLRMTNQEVRDEMKNLQGDPQVLQRRRAIQREMLKSQMKKTVPKADVVITNPTELAIAIEYKPEKMAAPVVVAKGAGVLAQQIRRLALEHGIPIVERKPLAQLLYKVVDVNRPIPNQAYAAVAEVLAYVYQLKNKQLPGSNR